MKTKTVDLGKILKKYRISVSAPARIDCGGTLDLKPLAILMEKITPSTVNIAINLRTKIAFFPYQKNSVCIKFHNGFEESFMVDCMPLNSNLGLLYSIITFFKVSNLRIEIQSDIPVKSGLGGSGALTVALIYGLSKILHLLGLDSELSKDQIAMLAHSIENGLNYSITGLQDQLAGVYGGVNKWCWQYSHYTQPYTKQIILDAKKYKYLEESIIIANTGEIRESMIISAKYIQDFLSGKNIENWIKILTYTKKFGYYISTMNWELAAKYLNKEAELRLKIIENLLSPIAIALKKVTLYYNCGFSTSGGNKPGSVWAIGNKESILKVRKEWQNICDKYKKGFLIPSTISEHGIQIENY